MRMQKKLFDQFLRLFANDLPDGFDRLINFPA